MVTKYELQVIVNNYFITTGTAPRVPISPDDCDQFAYNLYSYIMAIPGDRNGYENLLRYVMTTADYYGIDLEKGFNYIKAVPGIQNTFLQYIKDNYRIETNGEIVKRLVNEAFSYIGQTVAGGLWGLVKPLIPIFLLSLGAIFLLNKSSHKAS